MISEFFRCHEAHDRIILYFTVIFFYREKVGYVVAILDPVFPLETLIVLTVKVKRALGIDAEGSTRALDPIHRWSDVTSTSNKTLLLLLANDAGLALTTHWAAFLKPEGVQQSSLLHQIKVITHHLPNRLNRFETLSVQRHTVSEGLFHLLLFFIMAHGLIEFHLVQLFDRWVADLHPAQGVEVGEVIDFQLLTLFLRYIAPIQADRIVFKLDRALIEGNLICVTVYPLHRMNWPIFAIHVFNS